MWNQRNIDFCYIQAIQHRSTPYGLCHITRPLPHTVLPKYTYARVQASAAGIWGLRSSGLLNGVYWLLFTDISGQPSGPIFKGQAVDLHVLVPSGIQTRGHTVFTLTKPLSALQTHGCYNQLDV